jgi:hypothetical protein
LTEEIKAHLFANYTPNEKRRQEWESIADLDNVFNKLDAIINTMMQVKSDDEILGHIRRINSGEWD